MGQAIYFATRDEPLLNAIALHTEAEIRDFIGPDCGRKTRRTLLPRWPTRFDFVWSCAEIAAR
jgi:hypothetical protein